GEAAGAASSPHQKISYIIGKWQIMNLLGRYKDRQGDNFGLGQFHDELIKNGSLPVSVIEWILLDDPTSIEKALRKDPPSANSDIPSAESIVFLQQLAQAI